jgi:hypothetical protein
MPRNVDVLVEGGSKRTFACAAAWPGWCRAGRDDAAALETLAAYGERYASAMQAGGVRFATPASTRAFHVVERTKGNATTDFGAPDGDYRFDATPITAREWTRVRTILEACWTAFDRSVEAAHGRALAKGPRGGGRDLDAIVAHVVGAEASYVRKLTGDRVDVDERDAWGAREALRDQVLDGLNRAKAGALPSRGKRGGTMWKPRRFLRRAAWHVLDHAWEIEDRAEA